MLQISSGKFYDSVEPSHLHVTTHRGILYTNYRIWEALDTPIGSLLPSVRWGDQRSIICEVTERLPKPNGQLASGQIASVGPDPYINDFAALVAFRLNIVCTPDKELASRLINAQATPLGVDSLPKEYIPRVFDKEVLSTHDDGHNLSAFVEKLVSLERKRYVGVMRAIRRFVMAMHRISDDLDLAYAMLVAAIESLAQEFDEFAPEWRDYAQEKRHSIDVALKDAPDPIASAVRDAILKHEHAALGRRFREFVLHYLKPTFFREEANLEHGPAGRGEILLALKNAYQARSSFLHELQPLHKNLKFGRRPHDVELIGNSPYLTFHGLARVARHVILSFVEESPKVERQIHNYFDDYPNVISMPLSPDHWLGAAHVYSKEIATEHLSGFLQQIGYSYLAGGQRECSNLGEVLKKVETLVPNAKREVRLPMLTTYAVYSYFFPENGDHVDAFLKPYIDLFSNPTVYSLLAHFIMGEQQPVWPLKKTRELLDEYQRQRFRKKGIDAGSAISAALTLWIAELCRIDGDEAAARVLISQTIEEYPSHKGLHALEDQPPETPLPNIDHWGLIAPKLVAATAAKSG